MALQIGFPPSRTGEYIPLSQDGISSLISLFTMESSPDKADVFTFMFRAPLKALPSQFITCSFVEQLRSSDGNEPLREFPAKFKFVKDVGQMKILSFTTGRFGRLFEKLFSDRSRTLILGLAHMKGGSDPLSLLELRFRVVRLVANVRLGKSPVN
jgi:hypothetical protein